MRDRVQSIERGIDVLMALAAGPKTLTEVTRETGLSKGTVFRLLASLNYENLVVKDSGNVYMLGPGCLRLMQGVMEGLGAINAVARPALVDVWEETAETVTIHVRVGLERICIGELPSPEPIRYMSTVGASAPLPVGSAGRVLLAFMPQPELDALLPSLLPAGLFEDEASLRSELDLIRERGYALSSGERVKGAAAVSVPVHGRQGFLAALSVLGPDFRLDEERRIELVPHLRRAAETIGAALVDAGRSGNSGRGVAAR